MKMFKFTNIEHIIRGKAIGINYAVRLDAFTHNSHKSLRLSLRYHHRMNLTAAFQQSKDRHLIASPSPMFAFALSVRAACGNKASPYAG